MAIVDGYYFESVVGHVLQLFQPCELLLQGGVFGYFGVVERGGSGQVFMGIADEDRDLNTVTRPAPK